MDVTFSFSFAFHFLKMSSPELSHRWNLLTFTFLTGSRLARDHYESRNWWKGGALGNHCRRVSYKLTASYDPFIVICGDWLPVISQVFFSRSVENYAFFLNSYTKTITYNINRSTLQFLPVRLRQAHYGKALSRGSFWQGPMPSSTNQWKRRV